ncbi:MAG: DNA-processing protein DprA [Acidimicrobiaceae bacterium]|nr:DNA-processing protein DprA [Acidimicrobiaceae bacterium]MDE0606673.1 DNA-processing protein DprA [Acidimicrobiaceae bacterium]
MRRDDDSLATILLVSRLCGDGVRPLKASEFWSLMARIRAGGELNSGDSATFDSSDGPGVFLGLGQDRLVADYGLADDLAGRVAELVGRATAIAFELDRLEQSGIRALTVFDEHYPREWIVRLGSKAPPLMHAAGAVELFDSPGLGVVGSRDVSETGGETSKELAVRAASLGLPLVSGGARGVDQLAMNEAFEAGGTVVGILAESLLRKLKRPDVRRAVLDGQTVMCTPYAPGAPFSAGNAMGRNKLIYALAALTVVIASDHGTGGTWSGAAEALKGGFGPVAVWRGAGEGPGNEPLQQLGATAISNLRDLESLLHDSHFELTSAIEAHAGAVDQPSLFGTIG